MPEQERIEIPKLQGYYCFACGTANPIGLDLHFYRASDTICTDITLGRQHEGWEGMAHGGIIPTLLDEVMSWAILYFRKVFFVTRKMEVKYIKPVFIGIPLTIKGRLMESTEPPKIRASAEIMDDQGNVLARGSGEFVAVPEEKLSTVPEGLKEDMLSLFKRFLSP